MNDNNNLIRAPEGTYT